MDPISMVLDELDSTSQVSTKTLNLLDAIRTLQKGIEGVEVLRSMKHAYCSVAVVITVRELIEPVREGAFERRVRTLWKGNGVVAQALQEGIDIDTNSLGSKELWAWSQMITDPDFDREILVGILDPANALDDLKEYVKDERLRIGGANNEEGEPKPKKRREHVKWKPKEDAALLVGVTMHGHGWNLILNNFKGIFQRAPQDYRTPVDLKDRCRVLRRRFFQ